MEGLSGGQRKLAGMAILGWGVVKDDSNHGQLGGSLQWHSNGEVIVHVSFGRALMKLLTGARCWSWLLSVWCGVLSIGVVPWAWSRIGSSDL
jgi:hypothetical protein